MAEIQSFAAKSPLKDGPGHVEHSKNKGGEIQSFAATVPLKESPASLPMWGGTGNPIDSFAAKMPLKTTPSKGFQGTPMSDRTKVKK